MKQAVILFGLWAVSCPSGASPTEAPTGEECRQLAQQLRAAIEAGDLIAVNRFLDTAGFVERVVADTETPPVFLEKYLDGLIVSLQSDAWFGREVVDTLEAGGSYKLLRSFSRGGEGRAIFRMLSSDGRLNYHELVLERRGVALRVVDMFSYIAGEWLSTSHRRTLLRTARRETEAAYERILGASEKDSTDELARLDRLVQEHQHRKAFELLARLPEPLQNEKHMLVRRLSIAQELSDAHYLDAIARMRKLYSDDPSLDLVSLDAFARTRQYRRALETLDRLEASVGGDPFLDVQRAELYLHQRRYAEARRFASRAIVEDPLLEAGYRTLASIALGTHDWTLLMTALDGLPLELGDLRDVPEYQEFVASPEYEVWEDNQHQ